LLVHQIALTLIPGIGDIQGKKLVSYCGGVEAVFRENRGHLMKIPGIGEAAVKSILGRDIFKTAEKEVEFIRQFRIRPLFYTDKFYPERLKHCADSPMMLYFKGTADLNRPRVISIVGTRRPTEYGRETCRQLILDLADLDILVVSGLAFGIDTVAHKSALSANLKTIAILAHGLDTIYPGMNRPLAGKMARNGGLLTEFISGTRLNKDLFPRRNRIIAGMSDAVLVVESAEKGGALITADIANSYNRDVFAVPGRVGDTSSFGCNMLIKNNKAALVQSAADIRFMMGWDAVVNREARQHKLFINLNDEEKKVMDILGVRGEAGIDEIYLNSGLPASKVASILLRLEFEGLVRCLPGKIFRQA
jgi:DNA processing protein